mgnify:FL=1
MEKERFVIKLAGHQHLVSGGELLTVDRLKEEIGAPVVATDLLTGESVHLRVVERQRGVKIHGLKFKNKTRYLRRWGHRQDQTVLRVEESPPKAPAKPAKPAKKPATVKKSRATVKTKANSGEKK